MPKLKTNKSVAKRVKVTGTGKLKRNNPGRRHLLSHKSSKRKRRLRKQQVMIAAYTKSFAATIHK